MANQILIAAGTASLHEQVRRDLLKRINAGEFATGDMLPPEDALCRHYSVSRITIRRAVTDLAAEFYVSRKRGVGTVVTARHGDRRVFRLTGYFAEGQQLDTRVLYEEVVPADENVAEALKIPPGTPVQHTRSVTHRDKEPFTLVEAFVVAADGDQNQLNWQRVERAEQQLDAASASGLAAEHLGLVEGQPIMRARRVFYNSDNVPVRYTDACYHPDRYRFVADLRPRGDRASV